MMPFTDPMLPRESEDDCSFVSAQPQVRLSAAPILESIDAMRSSTIGHHTPKYQHGSPLWTLSAQLKAGQIPELATTLPHAN